MNTSIKAKDIMTKEVIIAKPNTKIDEVAKLMNIFRIGGVPVVLNKKVVGMITERDIMKHVVALNKRPSEMQVSDIMTSPPKVIGYEDEDLSSLAEKMVRYDVTRIPILDKSENIVGIVTNRDILKNSSEFLDILLEQAKIKGDLNSDYVAFGKCEICRQAAHLFFKNNRFICENCAKLKFKS
ncbi:MAG: CBS domain-containing protein [Candidatus Nanoarchaeia archaeon]